MGITGKYDAVVEVWNQKVKVMGSTPSGCILFHQQLFDPNMLLIKNKSCLYIQISSHSSLNRKNWIFCVTRPGFEPGTARYGGGAVPFSTESIHHHMYYI